MRTTSFAKVAALCGLLALSGCASKITQPDKYSGFLNNYSDLKETTSATGKPVLRWVDPSFDQSKYDSIVWNPITYYPVPKPSTQVGQKVLDKILNYTNTEMKEAIAQRKPLVTTAGPRSLIFRGAITGVDTSKEGLQFYEVAEDQRGFGTVKRRERHAVRRQEEGPPPGAGRGLHAYSLLH